MLGRPRVTLIVTPSSQVGYTKNGAPQKLLFTPNTSRGWDWKPQSYSSNGFWFLLLMATRNPQGLTTVWMVRFNPVNNGISTTNLNWWVYQISWTINSIKSSWFVEGSNHIALQFSGEFAGFLNHQQWVSKSIRLLCPGDAPSTWAVQAVIAAV